MKFLLKQVTLNWDFKTNFYVITLQGFLHFWYVRFFGAKAILYILSWSYFLKFIQIYSSLHKNVTYISLISLCPSPLASCIKIHIYICFPSRLKVCFTCYFHSYVSSRFITYTSVMRCEKRINFKGVFLFLYWWINK